MSDNRLTGDLGRSRRINPLILGLLAIGMAVVAVAQSEDQPQPEQTPPAQPAPDQPDPEQSTQEDPPPQPTEPEQPPVESDEDVETTEPDPGQVDDDSDEGNTAAESTTQPPPDSTDEDEALATLPPPPAAEPKDPKTFYGLATLIPALVAIALAIFTRQVVPALVVGVLVAAYMMVPCIPVDHALADGNSVIVGFRLAAETYVLGALSDPDKMKIIVFTMAIGFMVGVIGRNGGTEGMVHMVAGESRSRRRGALTAWLAGLVVFFDDYANTMIVGPTMRPVFDRLKLSRAKLAYIVDSTAAPVASLALIGTWVGYEIGSINEGLAGFDAGTAPAFLLSDGGSVVNGMTAFIYSLPYRFYPILALLFVLLVVLTGRDFGPMKRAERRTLSQIDQDEPALTDASTTPARVKPRWWLGFTPVLVLVAVTICVLVTTGALSPATAEAMRSVDASGVNEWTAKPWWDKAAVVIGNADAYMSIFYGAILSAFVAVILTMFARACPTRDAVDAGLEGMSRIMPAMVILVLAWSLSGVLQDLQLGDVVAERLKAAEFNPALLPLAVFVSSAGISFATGSSWTTMGILCPVTVGVGARLMADLDPTIAANLFYASVGSVLAGSVFGDHCSPISDTTVLSSLASGCRHEEHVWTQIPYAVVVAIAAMGLGDVMCSYYSQPWYLGLGAGAVFLVLWILIVGRRAVPSFELAEA